MIERVIRSGALWLMAAVTVPLAGCGLDTGGTSRGNVDAGRPMDAAARDAAPRDAGPMPDVVTPPVDAHVAPDACVPAPESCNMIDDDCNGVVDDGFDLRMDPRNCGRCGSVCPATLMCVRGRCAGDVIDIAAGEDFTCVARRDGAVFCWGDNTSDQLGFAGPDSVVPRAVPGVSSAVAITAGAQFACALRADNTVVCWGENGDAQLGRGTTTSREMPGPVAGLAGVQTISAGYRHVCVRRGRPGEIWCWGSSTSGQTGVDGGGAPHDDPTLAAVRAERLPGEPTLVEAGGDTTCAVLSGFLHCWGRDAEGELGVGGLGDSAEPLRVMAPAGAVQALSVGDQTVCALIERELYCWGKNEAGQVGSGTTSSIESTPVAVSTSITDFTDVDVGYEHTCARRAAGAVACWGSNANGQIGIGLVGGADVTVPADVTGLGGVTRIALGRSHTCALAIGGSVSCWGDNGQLQLGRPGMASGTPASVPIPPP